MAPAAREGRQAAQGGATMSDMYPPVSAALTSPPARSIIHAPPPPSETPTVPGDDTPGSVFSPMDERLGAIVAVARPSPSDVPDKDGPDPFALRSRVPTLDTVLKEVRTSHHTAQFLKNSRFFRKKADQDALFSLDLWGEIGELLIEVILACTPSSEADLESKTKLFEAKKKSIVLSHIDKYEPGRGEIKFSARAFEEQSLKSIIGRNFVDVYQRLITPLAGRKRTPISEQIQSVVQDAIKVEGGRFDIIAKE